MHTHSGHYNEPFISNDNLFTEQQETFRRYRNAMNADENATHRWSTIPPSDVSHFLFAIRRKALHGKDLLIEDMLPCPQADGTTLWIAA